MSRFAKDLPNGAQLATWKEQEVAALAERQRLRAANRDRRRGTWWGWRRMWRPRLPAFQATHTTHADRAQLCRTHGVANTGRQWRQLRKRLAREERAA